MPCVCVCARDNISVCDTQNGDLQEWKATQRIMILLKPRQRQLPLKNAVRAWCFGIVNATWFEMMITALIMGNIFTMMLGRHDNWKSDFECWQAGMFWVSVSFTVAFLLECIMKVCVPMCVCLCVRV